MKFSLGPILYFWSYQKVTDFYAAALDSPVDIIYLSETVCHKRNELTLEDWIDIAKVINAAGKQAVLSTMTLVESRADLSLVKKVCDNGVFLVEANDMSAVNWLSERKLPFCTGPAINIYNPQALKLLQRKGLQRWTLPVELDKHCLHDILRQSDVSKIETEVFSYGKLPLAYSARCFTARANNTEKDHCNLACIEHPEGLLMRTQEQQELFTINGIQTLSGQIYDVRSELGSMSDIGVDIMRFSPEENSLQAIKELHHEPFGSFNQTKNIASDKVNGYWHGQPGIQYVDGNSLT
ncbi:MAG: collagenase-like PrtC family protease [Flavobacteriales bacterium]|jgi:collagenase-like PrtC family protease